MNRTVLAIVSVISLSIASIFVARLAGSPVKGDEQVILFPVSAVKQSGGDWKIPAHAWVFEPNDWPSIVRIDDAIARGIAGQLGIADPGDKAATLSARVKWFAVDNEGGKQVVVELGTSSWTLGDTGSNGHAVTGIVHTGPAAPGTIATLKVRLPAGDARKFQGQVHFIPPAGVTVISDIDDTIKISNVLDKKQLLKNAFLEEHKVADGMPGRYAMLRKRGAYFHYVSASPWQLWPSLAPFIAEHYPPGTVSMRHFRLKDTSFIDFLLEPSSDYKLAAISSIIDNYPDHKFILIGDSGECDPEVYGEIFRKYPGKVDQIKIRRVTSSDFGDGRMKTAFSKVPRPVWELIGEDATIGSRTCAH